MDWILLIAALFIAFLIFTWLLKVVKATISTALTVAFIVLLVQLLFGIGPIELWNQIVSLWQSATQVLTSP
ncbi:MAG: hypothetical protein AAGD25_31045 [Cyanobacteria bacterium P01_F01_bin.150]